MDHKKTKGSDVFYNYAVELKTLAANQALPFTDSDIDKIQYVKFTLTHSIDRLPDEDPLLITKQEFNSLLDRLNMRPL